jgi:hypothetical protein
MPDVISKYRGPTFIELIPEELDLRVFRHQIETSSGPIPCWSYVTDGLRRHGQKEVVFTLRQLPGEDEAVFPRDLLDYFQLMYQQASIGKSVEAGGYSRFSRPGGFLGRTGAVGMTYVTASPLKGVNYPDRMLSAVLVTSDEIDAIRAHGSYRLLSLLGFRAQHYPHPQWSERDRPSLLNMDDVKKSLLGTTPIATARGLYSRRQRNQVHIHLPDDRAATVLKRRLEQLPARGPFVLLTDPDPEAKARLVWKPGMPVETIGSDNRPEASLTGGFIAFLMSSRAVEGVHVCEDGFAISMRRTTWEKVRQALLHDEPFTMPAEDGSLKLVCGMEADVEPVHQAGSHYYQPEDQLKMRVSPDELAWFDSRVGRVVEDHFADTPAGDGEALTVFCAIRPGMNARFWIECQPDEMPSNSHKLLLRRLAALKPPKVSAPVAWAQNFELWGGTGEPAHFARVPNEWSAAVPINDAPINPDQILDHVWPTA